MTPPAYGVSAGLRPALAVRRRPAAARRSGRLRRPLCGSRASNKRCYQKAGHFRVGPSCSSRPAMRPSRRRPRRTSLRREWAPRAAASRATSPRRPRARTGWPHRARRPRAQSCASDAASGRGAQVQPAGETRQRTRTTPPRRVTRPPLSGLEKKDAGQRLAEEPRGDWQGVCDREHGEEGDPAVVEHHPPPPHVEPSRPEVHDLPHQAPQPEGS